MCRPGGSQPIIQKHFESLVNHQRHRQRESPGSEFCHIGISPQPRQSLFRRHQGKSFTNRLIAQRTRLGRRVWMMIGK